MKCKKLLAVILTAAMCMGVSMTAFAAENQALNTQQQDAKDKGYDGSIEGHEFVSYQVFTGEYSDGVLSNIKWGNGVDSSAVVAALQNAGYLAADKTEASDVAEAIAAYPSYSDEAYKIAAIVFQNKSGEAGKLEGVAPGYYLVVDNGAVSDEYKEGYSYNLALLQVTDGTITPTVKNSVPTAEKKVKDVNDSTGTESDWQDSADYDIGDDVPFQLKGAVASNYDDYTTYTFIFHDEEESYFDFNNDVKVYLKNGDSVSILNEGYEVIVNPEDGDTFDVKFDNLKDIKAVNKESEIIVEYTAKLNDTAKYGNYGNTNTMYLEYSNNALTNDMGSTPKDTVIVFTYKAVINKEEGNQDKHSPLEGAGFTLFKKYASEPANLNLLTAETFADNANIDVEDYIGKGYYEVKKIEAANGRTQFEFNGLDDGEYLLVETETPTGYNSIAPIEFTVTALHTDTFDFVEAERTQYLTEFTGDKAEGNIDIYSNQAGESKSDVTNYVFNNAGSILPSTGGIGTTIFYVAGGLLIVAAIVLLISKKRMEKED
jgi:fimbrial isopeptide formation D2 family protein/LPXTG-motif cell wall-anchored protein